MAHKRQDENEADQTMTGEEVRAYEDGWRDGQRELRRQHAPLLRQRKALLAACQDAIATLDRWADNSAWDDRDDLTCANLRAAIAKARNRD